MQRKLNIVRAPESSPSDESNLARLLDQAAGKARAACDIADGIENIEDASIADLVDISNLCSAILRLINDAKAAASNNDPEPPATAAAATAPSTISLAA